MLPARRYAEWRPVAVRRWATEWAGMGAGLVTGLAMTLLLRTINYGSVMAALFVARITSGFLVDRQMRELRDEAEGGQFAATLKLGREAVYGFDEGLVAFADGWLVFSGRRCDFSLRSGDVSVKATDSRNLAFAFDGPEGEHRASLLFRGDRRLHNVVLNWMGNHKVAGKPVFPPVVPNPPAYAAVQATGFAVLISLAFVAIWAHFDLRGLTWPLKLLFGAALPALALYFWHVPRALRRLARGEPRRPVWKLPVKAPTKPRTPQ